MNSDSLQICYEHVFTNFISHKPGTNEYVYELPEHLNSFTGKKEIGLRSATVKCAARNLCINNIYFKNDKVLLNIDASISLGGDEDMSVANDKFKETVITRYKEYKDEIENLRIDNPKTKSEFGINDYVYEYNFALNEFWFKVLDKNNSYLYFPEADNYLSDDFKSVLGVDDSIFKNISLYQRNEIDLETLRSRLSYKEMIRVDDEGRIKAIGFSNVWNRGPLYISSTLSTLTEDKFLTLGNVKHNPLKYYEIKGYCQTFSIFLYDVGNKKSVEFPADGRDLIVLEFLIIGYN